MPTLDLQDNFSLWGSILAGTADSFYLRLKLDFYG